MKTFIIIPVYNERETILKILHRVLNVNIEKEIIVVDDGSSDGTAQILKNVKDNNIKKITWRQGVSAIFALLWYRFFD